MKNSHLIQRAAALALAAVMAVMTAGCGTKEQKDGATEGAKDSTKQTGNADPGTADVAKGRYVERLHIRLKLERNVLWISSRTRTGSW